MMNYTTDDGNYGDQGDGDALNNVSYGDGTNASGDAMGFFHICLFISGQMERDRRRAQTPAARGTLAPQPATTRVRTPATAERTRQQ